MLRAQGQHIDEHAHHADPEQPRQHAGRLHALLRDHHGVTHAMGVGCDLDRDGHHQRHGHAQSQSHKQALDHGRQNNPLGALPGTQAQRGLDLQQPRFDLPRCGLGQDEHGPESGKCHDAQLHAHAEAKHQHGQWNQGHRGNGAQHFDCQKAHVACALGQSQNQAQHQAE